jgi:hypothetical protein
VPVLLLGGVYEVRHCDGIRCHDIHSKFLDYKFRHSCSTKVNSSNILAASMLVLLMEEIYAVGMASEVRYMHQVL